MASVQSALLDLLAPLKLTGVTDWIRSAVEMLYQELINAEATAFADASPFGRSEEAPPQHYEAPDVDYSRGGPGVENSKAVHGVGLSRPAGAAPPRRLGIVRRRDGGLRPRRPHPQGRLTGQSAVAVQGCPSVFLDASSCKARVGHRIVFQVFVVAVGVAADGRREVPGSDVGDSEREGFWIGLLRSSKTRGLMG